MQLAPGGWRSRGNLAPSGTLRIRWRFFLQAKNSQEPTHEKVSCHRAGRGEYRVVRFRCQRHGQTVSGGDSYQQGYAAGASAKERNSFNAFDSGYAAGQRDQNSVDNQVASTQAYNNGYQAGLAQAESARTQAYNQGYENRAAQERIASARAFDDGFHAGAARQAARDDAEYP